MHLKHVVVSGFGEVKVDAEERETCGTKLFIQKILTLSYVTFLSLFALEYRIS